MRLRRAAAARSEAKPSEARQAGFAGRYPARPFLSRKWMSKPRLLFLEALKIAQDVEDSSATAYACLGLARLYLRQDDAARTESHFKRAVEFLEASDDAEAAVALASYDVLAGNHEVALRRLKKAVDLGHPRVWIATDHDLAPLRGNPEFEALIADPL